MDTAFKDGDFSPGAGGLPERIGGERELLQRAMIRLNMPLGGFDYDPLLGSKLNTLKPDDADFAEKAAALAREALRPLPELTVQGVRRSTGEQDGMVLVQFGYNGKNTEIGVKL